MREGGRKIRRERVGERAGDGINTWFLILPLTCPSGRSWLHAVHALVFGWGMRGRGDIRGRSGRASPWLRPAGNPRSGNGGRSGCGPTLRVTSSRVTEAAPTALARGLPRGRPWVSTASGCITHPCAP